MDEDKSKFLVTLAYGRLSALEIASILDRDSLDFEILRVSDRAVLVECDSKTAKSLIRETGGSYKIARIFGETIEELYEEITLPDEAKFNWTVSGYDCDSELLENTKLSVQSFLKSRSLGKSRFIPPNAESEDDDRKTPGNLKELKIKDVFERILFPEGKIPEGLDIVVAGGFAKGPLFGCTLAASDVLGFQKRDFSRSYQNPTMTLGPRLGRILVNLGMKYGGGTLLDPFCGLG
ncbi:MAG: hypothetical protein JRN67_08780, partial [Nitrososphaerota archaeon]|nr:hypothetical protein [Nitrososphaerota archaeon]